MEPLDDMSSAVNLKSYFASLNSAPELMEYCFSLRQALAQQRNNGAIFWCDPRDLGMVAKLSETHWKPTVTLKLPDSEIDNCLGFTSKQTALDEDVTKDMNEREDGNVKKSSSNIETFVCGVHGCNAISSSIAHYESHYYTSHNFRCASCKRIFVSNFLLDVHIEENHDSYFKALSSRVAMYRCLVENCTEKFKTDSDRQNHLVEQHRYPHKFSFHRPIKSKPQSQGPTTLKETGHDYIVSSTTESVMQTDEINKPETDLSPSSPAGKVNKGNRVPSKICFGRGAKRAFKNRPSKHQDYQWYRTGKMDVDTTVDIENIDFKDLSDSIPNIS